MVNSSRNTDHDDIIIGRQQSTPDGVIPNDICLFYSDRAISRVHCKIVTKFGKMAKPLLKFEGFKVPRTIPDNFVAFLMMGHPRLGAKSPGKGLEYYLYHYIYDFIKRILSIPVVIQ